MFSGQQNPLETGWNNIRADGAAAVAKAKADALAAANQTGQTVLQHAVDTASPGAVIFTPPMMLAAVVIVAVLLMKKK